MAREDLALVLGMAAVLAAFLARGRVYQMLGARRGAGAGALELSANIVVAMRGDLLFVAGITAVFGAAIWLGRGQPGLRRVLKAAWVALVAITVLMALVNVVALHELGQPLTYQWLYYSDFLTSLDAFNTMAGLLSLTLLGKLVGKCAVVVLLGVLAGRALAPLLRSGRTRLPLGLGVGVLAVYGLLSAALAHAATVPRLKVQNPLIHLVASAVAPEGATLYSTATPIGPEDFQTVAERAPGRSPWTGAAARAGIRNVVVFVLESVPAKYLGAYGGREGLTPEIDAAAAHARVFTRAYAHVPGTAQSMVSLLLSAYHPHSFRILTREDPHVPLPSLSGELKASGHRTGLFYAADTRFQRGDEFLAGRGFDLVTDHRTIPCDHEVFLASTHEWPFADGIQDGCVVNAMLRWIGTRDRRPFAAMLWTMQTHYPYFISGPEGDHAVRGSPLNRYLTALHEGDSAFGELMRGLERQGLRDSTLVVVLGDHGEAFGEHTHSAHHLLYEEDVRIPLLLINPRLFHGERDTTMGGMIDIAPTLLDLLGDSLPSRWQGRSLFDPDRSGRVYFFAPFSTVYFGYREGSRKLIYDAGLNTGQIFDLSVDPGETTDLAARKPEAVASGRDRLAAWARYQRDYYAGLPEERRGGPPP
jgi:arylsulfatase A-like enzyme